jgi:hypothetical protein
MLLVQALTHGVAKQGASQPPIFPVETSPAGIAVDYPRPNRR